MVSSWQYSVGSIQSTEYSIQFTVCGNAAAGVFYQQLLVDGGEHSLWAEPPTKA